MRDCSVGNCPSKTGSGNFLLLVGRIYLKMILLVNRKTQFKQKYY